MTWDTGENAVKVFGWILVGVAAITTIAKVWTNTAKDKLIEIFEKELSISRQHIEQCDKDVLHYRAEMHEVRKESQAKVFQADTDMLILREKLKQMEIDSAVLISKTDLSPVMVSLTNFIKDQTEINSKILTALKQLTNNK